MAPTTYTPSKNIQYCYLSSLTGGFRDLSRKSNNARWRMIFLAESRQTSRLCRATVLRRVAAQRRRGGDGATAARLGARGARRRLIG
eukprot:6213574-Pleurochrysis_carterae.AAC.5